MSYPPQNLMVPYKGLIQGGIFPGRMIRVQGNVNHMAQRFAINLQCGPNTEPRDDIALHFSPQFTNHTVIRNTLQNLMWGPEESVGHFPFGPGQPFEVILLCEGTHFKIAVNGQHYCEFEHRMAFQRVSHITIDGDVDLSSVRFEDPPPEIVPGMVAQPQPSVVHIMPMAYQSQPAAYPSVQPPPYSVSAPAYGAPPYQPPSPTFGGQPQYQYGSQPQRSGGLGPIGAGVAGAAAGMAIGGLGGYALSNALRDSASSCSDCDD